MTSAFQSKLSMGACETPPIFYSPTLHLLIQPHCLCILIINKAAKVAPSCDHIQSHAMETVLSSGDIPRGYNQDSIGWFWEVSPWWPPPMEVLEVGQYVAKTSPHPCVISIPWMCDARVCILEISDDREYPYVICDHGQRVPMGHTLVAMKDVDQPL